MKAAGYNSAVFPLLTPNIVAEVNDDSVENFSCNHESLRPIQVGLIRPQMSCVPFRVLRHTPSLNLYCSLGNPLVTVWESIMRKEGRYVATDPSKDYGLDAEGMAPSAASVPSGGASEVTSESRRLERSRLTGETSPIGSQETVTPDLPMPK